MPSGEKESIGRAELYGVLEVVESKISGVPLHVVTESETVHAGLRGKCAKWGPQGWVGLRGLLAHGDLSERLWSSWQLFGGSVSQWVPSHVGMLGNEHVAQHAQQGAAMVFLQVRAARLVREVWQELGLKEMLGCDDGPETMWGSGGSESHSSDSRSSMGDRAYVGGDSDSESDCELCEGLVNRRCAHQGG